jgi:hypothetical protein
MPRKENDSMGAADRAVANRSRLKADAVNEKHEADRQIACSGDNIFSAE